MEAGYIKSTKHAPFAAGVIAGIAGLLVFLLLHALWIVAIWDILPLGLLIVVVGGLAVGWSYQLLNHRLPSRPWRALGITALIVTILLPSMILRELREPLFTVTQMGNELVSELAVSPVLVVVHFVGELLLTATITGGLLGWWLGRTRQAVIATALAGFFFALGPGHNIPFLSGMGFRTLRLEISILLPAIVVSALVLVEVHYWLTSQRRQGRLISQS